MASIAIKNRDLQHVAIHPREDIVAVVGRRSSLVLAFDRESIAVLQCHLDEDKDENLTCTTFFDATSIFLAVGGRQGIVKIINVSEYRFSGFLRGHGGSVTHLRVHSRHEGILFSASEDTTVRMWDCKTKTCLAIFGGCAGHRDYVLSIDVSMCGENLVSSGTDCTIKVWKIPTCDRAQVESVYFPVYSSSRIHKSYVVSTAFYGKLVISQSLGNRLVAVYPDFSTEIYNAATDSDSVFINEYQHPPNEQLTTKFSIHKNTLVTAARSGSVLVFDLNNLSKHLVPSQINTGWRIRDVAVRGDTVFVLNEDSTVGHFSLSELRQQSNAPRYNLHFVDPHAEIK